MRHGGKGRGVFSGDYEPPEPWRLFGIKLRAPRGIGGDTELTIGALTDEELHWVARVVVGELGRRVKKQLKEESMVPANAIDS